ncbi:ABC transporter ATP-binding protein [Lachnospiraceae bacterium OF09-6]|nr:ABC transporter ATP-binding protein [Lachnospiraceae bacterium OF09-6]
MKITTEDIRVSFHAREILSGVSIESENKELVGLIGPNGSGKSTLLKCIYRILKPDAGAVYLDEEELHSMSVKDSARKMAVVAQHNYYNFDFTVREVVLMGRAPHKKTLERDNARDYQIVDEALKTVQMERFAERTFSTLSGGEQQRVILARALAQQTPALILDEPTNHLDITHQIMLMELVKKLNVTVISAIHDLNIAAAYCDKIYVLKDGNLEGYGTPQDVLTPELIYRIYRVESEIVYDSHGKMHILFL